ncbi:type II toxin-antitoxin system RelE/ParE family toxin [Bacterioplanoides sp.]|uniref:type II toxin-antitoxin system RelE/ParE family toxin n=1 Tax=Bacterioplanoides sp. TaxID=2066072 RepID=UPI003B006EA9
MSDEQKKIDVYESRRFAKALAKLPESQLQQVEDQIDLIISEPAIGVQKKGDLSYLWVHKFKVDAQQVLLGYSWIENRLELYLLSLGSHENFYQGMKKQRGHDLKLFDS